MAKIEGLDKLLSQLAARVAQAEKDGRASVAAGYSAGYSLRVHEDLEVHHPNGQAKFLEEPTRTEQPALAEIVAREMQAGKSLAEAERAAAEYLLARSQELVPVRTGNLKSSGFVEVQS